MAGLQQCHAHGRRVQRRGRTVSPCRCAVSSCRGGEAGGTGPAGIHPACPHRYVPPPSPQKMSEKNLTVPSSPPGVFTHTLTTPSVSVSQTLYSHRYYSNIMVMEVLMVRHVTSEKPFTVEMVSSFTPQSKDIQFQFGPDYKGGR